jgi:hypothetical protein
MTYGLTPTGFVIPTLAEIRTEINDEVFSLFGASVDVSDNDPLGQLIGIMSERELLLWELGQTLYAAMDPAAATGTLLDALCALTGTVRREALGSIAALVLTGTAATSIAAGNTVSVTTTNEVFATLETVELAAVAAWTAATAYAIGDRVTNDSDKVYQATTGGTSAGSGGPTGTTTGIADNTVVWDYQGTRPAAADVEAESTSTGPIVAVARDKVTIEKPVSGLSNVINLTHPELRPDKEK